MSEPDKSAPPPAPAMKPHSKLFLLLGVGILLGGGGLTAYFFLMRPKAAAEAPHAATNEKTDDGPSKPQIVTLKPIVVNLRNSKATRFLKVTLSFQTNSKKTVEDLRIVSPEVADFLVNKLSDLEVTDIDNLPGRTKLKREIMNGVNELLDGGFISAVFFNEFVIQ